MNKIDLVAAVAEAANMHQADAADAVDGVFEVITAALKAGEEIRIPGFGVFSVAECGARQGHSPQTGETLQIAASKRPRFKTLKALKDAVNK